MAYAVPMFSLFWLALFSLTGVARPDYLVIGTTLIIIANLLINVDLEVRWRVRWAFKALLIGLITFGTLVHLRDDIFDSLGISQWSWGSNGYFESIGLSATVFTLILAFRVARMVTRTNDENGRIFSVFRKLDLLSQWRIIDRKVLNYVREIADADNDDHLKAGYEAARKHIVRARRRLARRKTAAEIKVLLNQAESDLDTLVHSRQVEVVPGERFGLSVFAVIIIVLAIGTMPAVEDGWLRLMVDLFAMLLSSVVVFLLINVSDLQREREERRFSDPEPDGEYLVLFPDIGNKANRFLHYSDQWVYMVVGAGIILVYVALFWLKWL